MVTDPARKEFVVEMYKDRLFSIPCRHFNRELMDSRALHRA